MKRVRIVMLVFALLLQAYAHAGEKVRIGVLYKKDVAASYLKGIKDALDDAAMGDSVDIEEYLYRDEKDGLRKLTKWIRDKEGVDIVIGPTDSSTFSKALELRDDLETHEVPVISPLVTATGENQPDGWFFRMNIDVGRRVNRIYDYLNKYMIRSIAVLYADTAFGRKAEAAFRENLNETQEHSYQALQFESLAKIRPALAQILKSRPEALGVFGSNTDIRGIHEELRSMNSWGTPYKPLLFTIMDARGTGVEGIHFVSSLESYRTDPAAAGGEEQVAGADGTGGAEDEFEALAYDTTAFVLSKIKEAKRRSRGDFNPKVFRREFAALLRNPADEPGRKTGMVFDMYENTAKPKIFRLGKEQPVKVTTDDVVSWRDKVNKKWELLKGRYGWWPAFNILLLIVVVGLVSLSDLRRWYSGNGPESSHRRTCAYYFAFVSIHVLLVLGIYLYLAETGKVRYDSILTALIIAIAPTAFIRTTLFVTPGGREIGLVQLYDRFLLWFNDKVMVTKFLSEEKYVNIIAYHNSLADLKGELELLYQSAKSMDQRFRLQTALQEELQEVELHIEKRKVCARRLLRRLGWEQLKQRRFVPPQFAENPVDPRAIIRTCVNHCYENNKRNEVVTLLENRLEEMARSDPELHEELVEELKKELKEAKSARGKTFVRIRFLMVQLGFDPTRMKREGLLPDDYAPQ